MKRALVLSLLLIGLFTGRVAAINPGKMFFTCIPSSQYKAHNRNFDVVCDSTGQVYIANFEGLLVYNGTSWKVHHTPGISKTSAVFKASDGKIWFGGINLIGYISPDSSQPEYISSDLDMEFTYGDVEQITERDGNILFSTTSGETYIVRDSVIQLCEDRLEDKSSTYGKYSDFSICEIIRIEDQGISITGTDGAGVVVTDEETGFSYSITTDDGLFSNNVSSLAYDGKGHVWGTTDQGLFVISAAPVYSTYSQRYGLQGSVCDILYHSGSLYVGTYQGLFKLDDEEHFSRIGDLKQACYFIEEFNNEQILAATAQGVMLIGKDIKYLTHRHTLSAIPFNDTDFITGELEGLYFHSTDGKDSLIAPIPHVRNLDKTQQGGIIATAINEKRYYAEPGSLDFTPADSIESPDIISSSGHVCENNDVWLPRDRFFGIKKVSGNENEEKWSLPMSDFLINGSSDHNGKLWIGGSFGFLCLDLNKMREISPYVPKLYIHSFIQKDDNISVSASNDMNYPIGIVKYYYRLHDDDNWTQYSNNSELVFNKLSPGSYEFQIRSEDPFGNEVFSEIKEFKIKYPVPFRWYFLVIYSLLLVFLIRIIINLRVTKEKQEQARLESIVNKRTSELKEAQGKLLRQEREMTIGKLTSGLIDRILNPVNYINNFSHLSQNLTRDLKENIEHDRELMDQNTYEDSVDIIQMLNSNMEKIEQHGMSTTKVLKAMEELLHDKMYRNEDFDLNHLCSQVVTIFKTYYSDKIAAFDINVLLEECPQPVIVNVSPDQTNKSVSYILSNSIYAIEKKCSKADISHDNYQPEIRVSISTDENGKASISVYDNGIGIEEKIIDKIFDPFFTTKATAEAPGVGLYLVQQYIQDIGGNISVQSVKDVYTEFKITF